MTQLAKERAKWKARTASWTNELAPSVKRPVRKLIVRACASVLPLGSNALCAS